MCESVQKAAEEGCLCLEMRAISHLMVRRRREIVEQGWEWGAVEMWADDNLICTHEERGIEFTGVVSEAFEGGWEWTRRGQWMGRRGAEGGC